VALMILVEPLKQFDEAFWNPLVDDIVVHRPQLLADLRLDIAPEIGTMGGRLPGIHGHRVSMPISG